MSQRQAKRWLATWDMRWKRIREAQLAGEPLCRHCKARGEITSATEVDHIDGRALTAHDYRAENLQSLCTPCHSVKTAIENGSFGRKPGSARQRGCDINGTPLDGKHPWRTSKS